MRLTLATNAACSHLLYLLLGLLTTFILQVHSHLDDENVANAVNDGDGNVQKLPAVGATVESVCPRVEQSDGGNGTYPDGKSDLRRRDEEKKEKEGMVTAPTTRMVRAVGFSKKVDQFGLFRTHPIGAPGLELPNLREKQNVFRYSPLELHSIRCFVEEDSPTVSSVNDFLERFKKERSYEYCDQKEYKEGFYGNRNPGKCTGHTTKKLRLPSDELFATNICGSWSDWTVKCVDFADVLREIVEECKEMKNGVMRVEGLASYTFFQEYKYSPGIGMQHAFITGDGVRSLSVSLPFLYIGALCASFLLIVV